MTLPLKCGLRSLTCVGSSVTVTSCCLKNRIFIDRMSGVGAISQEEAISYSLTGPLLRATGVPYDVRKAQPYSGYERF